jgi:transposase
MRKIAYLAMDVHARHCTLGEMSADGTFRGNCEFVTSENNIIDNLKAVKAHKKYLTIEQGTLTFWTAQVASAVVDKVITCDPVENALIYKSPQKRDKVDTRQLCRLLRLGELKHVYQPQNDQRAIFKAAARHYIDLRDQVVRLKQKIKAMYRYWGVIDCFSDSVYSPKGREAYLKRLKHTAVVDQISRLYQNMDQAAATKREAKKAMIALGRNYPEIREFKKITGISDVNAHIFDALIQTPHRFANRSCLYKYCRLSVTDRSSDGKPLGYKRLEKAGLGELKVLSHRAFMSAMSGDNEVKRFYLSSLKRTHNHVHARLNTQRKILGTMYSIWKKGEPYRSELFLGPSN